MGGYGSGRIGWRPHVEACPAVLDANNIGREVRRQTGQGLEPASTLEMHASYRTRGDDGGWHDVTHCLSVELVPCRFGGTRPFLLCRGAAGRPRCWRRVVKLYLCRGVLLCRRCNGLAYAGERYGEHDRAVLQAGKIKRRLGGNPDVLARFPRKPKGMWQRTYERERQRYREAERRIDCDAFISGAARA